MTSLASRLRSALLVVLVPWLAAGAQARPAERPVQTAPLRIMSAKAQGGGPLHLPPGCGAPQRVAVDLAALATLETGMRVDLASTGSVPATGVVERVVRTSDRQFTIGGRIEGELDGFFNLVVEEDVLVGTIDLPSRGKRYRLQLAGPGDQVIGEVEPAGLPPCGGGVPFNGNARERAEAPAPPAGRIAEAANDVPECAGVVFDVMIAYTSLARAAAGGTNAIRALCKLAVADSNVAYTLSLVNARVRLVWCDEIVYGENGTYLEHLNRLTDTADGIMDSVHTIRDQYKADLVDLWVDDGEYCGLAWCWSGNQSLAFSVTTWYCESAMAFAHELGHNQGCNHDRENEISGCNASTYSYGYRVTGNNGVLYRTIMSYAPGQSIARFSNPDVTYQGVPVGVPIGQPLESHNAQTINNTASIVDSFRNSAFDVWVDYPFGGSELGTFANPFNTTAEGVNAIGVAVNGTEIGTLWIKSGATPQGVTISKPMLIKPCGGPVTIGGSP